MQNVPYYDFPQSPILIIGFFGILVALAVLLLRTNHIFQVHLMRITSNGTISKTTRHSHRNIC